MTITTLPVRNEYVATSGQTVFNYTFKIYASTDLNVYITPSGQAANDSTDIITGYSVSGVGDEDGGAITLTTPATLGDRVTIVSGIPENRTTDYQNNGDFRPDVVNDDFDRVVSIVKQIEDTVNRGVVTEQSQQGSKPLSLPVPDAGKFLSWKSDLSGLENVIIGTGDVVLPVLKLSDYASLAAAVTAIGSTETELWIDQDETVQTNVTVPSTLTLYFINGKKLSDDSNNADLTINGVIKAGLNQHILSWGNGSGDLTINSSPVSIKWTGATGNGSSDDGPEIQTIIDAVTECEMIVPGGNYLISRNTGTNDRWGINITNDAITLNGLGSPTFKRYNTDISTYALAYPLILVGNPDSDVASPVTNTTIKNIIFDGQDTRHAATGDSLHDARYAIELKNINGVVIDNCKFTKIDSSAIWFQKPGDYDYANSQYYNTTKSYNARVSNCYFSAVAHAVVERALIHTIDTGGVDDCIIANNIFSWCDNAITQTSTYEDFDDTEDDTYTDPNVGAVKRCGRDLVISNNLFYNSSEHAVYCYAMDSIISNNVFRTDEFSICACNLQIRGRGVTVTGNTFSGFGGCIIISELSRRVVVSGNNIFSQGETTGAVIDIDSTGLSAFVDNRSYFSTYYTMDSIVITGNTILFPTTQNDALEGNAIGIFSDASDANYPEGQIRDVTISGNAIKNCQYGIKIKAPMIRNINVNGNTFDAKPFTTGGFSSGTTLYTEATVLVSTGSNLQYMSFNSNMVNGSAHVFKTYDGTPSSEHLPIGVQGNTLNYIKLFAESGAFVVTHYTNFHNNVGVVMLDRTGWISEYSINNHLGDGSSINSYRKYCIEYDTTDVNFITDDSGTKLKLSP